MKINLSLKVFFDGSTPAPQQVIDDIVSKFASISELYEISLDKQVKVKYDILKIKEIVKRKPQKLELCGHSCTESFGI